MKKYFFLLFILFLLMPYSAFATCTPTLKDYFNTGDDDTENLGGTQWFMQSFTTSESYTVSSVKIKAGRYTDDGGGIFTIGIRNTSGSVPTGSDLCSGTLDATTITAASSSPAWYEWTMSAGCNLEASTLYALVLRSEDSGYVFRDKYGGNGYAGGGEDISGDSGATWNGGNPWNADMLFEVYECEEPPAATTGTELNFPEILITLFAVFLICLGIDRGTPLVVDKIKGIYKYKLR